MRNSVQKPKNKTLTCPHCDQTYNTRPALAAHIRDKHANTLPSGIAQPQAKKEKKGNAMPVSVALPSMGAHEHLKTALEALTQRNRQITEELARREALQAEKQVIRKQIDAVNSALQVFVRMIGVGHDSNVDIKVAESREPEKLAPVTTFVDKALSGKSSPRRRISKQRRKIIEARLKAMKRIINKFGMRLSTRHMALLLSLEGFVVSHAQVFKDYRTLKI